ncbi:unnamed protein product [Bursaphelenchus xylophilus]|uniref:(pine wood nematode) hypothetical protein n=1 Tax=Bursaphelenchus xylophilus TaxID=6326 RepID=A0A1I7RYZ1_BURXY|nr:unnamed protein product [Bursaphelenchus xylophilus]CAG9107018.1 unnamed protein product [Bursaphelenchus xylophilus]
MSSAVTSRLPGCALTAARAASASSIGSIQRIRNRKNIVWSGGERKTNRRRSAWGHELAVFDNPRRAV